MCWTLGGALRCFSTGAKTGDVPPAQVSLAVVRMATLCGLERHGDHVVNVVGCGVCSSVSVMSFRTAFSAV